MTRTIDHASLHLQIRRFAPFVRSGIIDFSEAIDAVMQVVIQKHFNEYSCDVLGIESRLTNTLCTAIQTAELNASQAIRETTRRMIARRAHRMVILEFAHMANRKTGTALPPSEVELIAREEVTIEVAKMRAAAAIAARPTTSAARQKERRRA